MDLWNRFIDVVGPRRVARVIPFYPPYLLAGLRVREASADLRRVEVEMPLLPWNRSYVGSHVGGTLYTMCDPFPILMLATNLGAAYDVVDKSCEIRFIRPGRGTVRARFELSADAVRHVRDEVDAQGKSYPRFEVAIVDAGGRTVARIDKTMSVKRARGPA